LGLLAGLFVDGGRRGLWPVRHNFTARQGYAESYPPTRLVLVP
jgi:hypothetical protein